MKVSLMDCHVHVDNIRVYDPTIAKHFNRRPGQIKWKGGTVEQHIRHIEKDNIEQLWAIYENPESVTTLQNASPHCDVRGMYFVRDVKNVDKKHLEDLHKQGLLDGLKVHPLVDHYELTTQNLTQVLAVAAKFNLPVLYHSDDRKDFMELTAPYLQELLIQENPDVRFIIGHGGAYANPRMIGSHPSVISYWNGDIAPYPRIHLINCALKLANNYDNAYYDLSIALNKIKASLIAGFVNKHPDTAEKVLVGSDFPIKSASATSQVRALENAGLRKSLLERVTRNRLE